MILIINLSTEADRNTSSKIFYVSHEDVENGVHVDYMLPTQYHKYVDSIYVKACDDGEHVEVVSKYGTQKYPITQEGTWKSGYIGLSYASCEIRITLIPYMQEHWDVLLVTHNGVTSMIARDEMATGMNLENLRTALNGSPIPGMDLEVCYMTDNRLGLYGGKNHSEFYSIKLYEEPTQRDEVSLSLDSFSTLITEWDYAEKEPIRCIVDTKDLEDSLTDKNAALRIAKAVNEQHPDKLELTAKYMKFAADLGEEDAIAWLNDYSTL